MRPLSWRVLTLLWGGGRAACSAVRQREVWSVRGLGSKGCAGASASHRNPLLLSRQGTATLRSCLDVAIVHVYSSTSNHLQEWELALVSAANPARGERCSVYTCVTERSYLYGFKLWTMVAYR